ncbi:ABC transporter substrate-binding protein [Streptomyces sp. NPDC048551]|uniref:ABC transporter substrate-binding protein n=1 Tax=Streptomyces sp. NPDC048551 TaxID=3155758 RepID=UPI00343C3A17
MSDSQPQQPSPFPRNPAGGAGRGPGDGSAHRPSPGSARDPLAGPPPEATGLLLSGARLTDGRTVDVRLSGGRIQAVGTAGSLPAPALARVDLRGYLLLPAPAEPHAHGDTALTADAEGPVSYTPDEVQRRATEAALLQLGHGATALRSHIRIGDVHGLGPMEAALQARRSLRGLTDLTAVADTLKIPAAGDPAKAKELLKAAGKEHLKVTLAVSTGDKGKAEAFQQGLARAGVEVVIDTVDPGAYYDAIGDLSTTPDMTYTGWCPDYPSGSTWLPFVFDGRTIKDKGNQGNYSQFRDDATMKRIDEINAMADAKQANQAWIDLDAEIMKKSPSIPILRERKPLLVGPNIAGAYGHPVWTGTIDYGTVGLKDPSKSQG